MPCSCFMAPGRSHLRHSLHVQACAVPDWWSSQASCPGFLVLDWGVSASVLTGNVRLSVIQMPLTDTRGSHSCEPLGAGLFSYVCVGVEGFP